MTTRRTPRRLTRAARRAALAALSAGAVVVVLADLAPVLAALGQAAGARAFRVGAPYLRRCSEGVGYWSMSNAAAVSFAKLGRELGISVDARHDIVSAGLVRPVTPPKRGRAVLITPDDAARVRAAALLAAVIGVAVIVVLRLLAGSGASVSGGAVTIPLP